MDKEQLLSRLKRGYCPNSYITDDYGCDYDFECENVQSVQREKCWDLCMENYELVVSDEPIYPIIHWDYSFDLIKK